MLEKKATFSFITRSPYSWYKFHSEEVFVVYLCFFLVLWNSDTLNPPPLNGGFILRIPWGPREPRGAKTLFILVRGKSVALIVCHQLWWPSGNFTSVLIWLPPAYFSPVLPASSCFAAFSLFSDQCCDFYST